MIKLSPGQQNGSRCLFGQLILATNKQCRFLNVKAFLFLVFLPPFLNFVVG